MDEAQRGCITCQGHTGDLAGADAHLYSVCSKGQRKNQYYLYYMSAGMSRFIRGLRRELSISLAEIFRDFFLQVENITKKKKT